MLRKNFTLTVPLLVITGIYANDSTAEPILWVSDWTGNLGTIDIDSGSVTIIGDMGKAMTYIAFDPSGGLWGVSGGFLQSS
jgi:hypothetical protein